MSRDKLVNSAEIGVRMTILVEEAEEAPPRQQAEKAVGWGGWGHL